MTFIKKPWLSSPKPLKNWSKKLDFDCVVNISRLIFTLLFFEIYFRFASVEKWRVMLYSQILPAIEMYVPNSSAISAKKKLLDFFVCLYIHRCQFIAR